MTKYVIPTIFLFILTSCLSFSVAFARDHTYKEFGTVESISPDGFTIQVESSAKKSIFTIDKFSDFEIEYSDRSKKDHDVPFSELKVGDTVKVEAYPAVNGGNPIVDDLEIRR